MKSWHLIVDVARCHDCNDCFLADKDEFVDNEFPPYSAAQPWHGHRWMNIKRKERGQYPLVETAYLPMPCMHCDAAPCLTTDGAVYKRPDGLVIIDPVKAKGRKEIVASCPYSAIYWNEEKQLAQKCTGCAHLLDDGWTETRCSQVCPTEAIKLVLAEEDDVERMVEDEGLARYRDSLGTKPRVLLQEPAPLGQGVRRRERRLRRQRRVRRRRERHGRRATAPPPAAAPTDLFGEVKVDHLTPGHEYQVRIEADGYRAAELTVQLDASVTAGTVRLDAGSTRIT